MVSAETRRPGEDGLQQPHDHQAHKQHAQHVAEYLRLVKQQHRIERLAQRPWARPATPASQKDRPRPPTANVAATIM